MLYKLWKYSFNHGLSGIPFEYYILEEQDEGQEMWRRIGKCLFGVLFITQLFAQENRNHSDYIETTLKPLLENGRIQLAIDWINDSISKDPFDCQWHYIRAKVWYYHTPNLSSALQDINNAMFLGKHDASAFILRGFIYKDLEHYATALKNFDNALEINPDLYYLKLEQAILQTETGMYSQAVKSASVYIYQYPNDPLGYYIRYVSKVKEGIHEDWLNDLKLAVELYEKDGNAPVDWIWQLALAHFRQKDYLSAFFQFDKYWEFDSDNPYAFCYRTVCLSILVEDPDTPIRSYIPVYEVCKDVHQAVHFYPDILASLELMPVLQNTICYDSAVKKEYSEKKRNEKLSNEQCTTPVCR